jgi:hypothetical protein
MLEITVFDFLHEVYVLVVHPEGTRPLGRI